MIWTSNYETFHDAVSGRPCYVNTTPDAWVMLDPSESAIERVVSGLKRSRGHPLCFWQTVDSFPRSGLAADAEAWLARVCRSLPSAGGTIGWLRLLTQLRQAGVLLWPSGQPFMPFPGYPHFTAERKISAIWEGSTVHEQDLIRRADNTAVTRATLFSMSPADNVDDVSQEGLLRSLSVFVSYCNDKRDENDAVAHKHLVTKSITPSVLSLFRLLEAAPRSDGSNIQFLERAEHHLSAAGRKGRQRRRWPIYLDTNGNTNPEIERWIAIADKYLQTRSMKREAALKRPLNRWLRFVSNLPEIPSVLELEREKHFNGPKGFFSSMADLPRSSDVAARTLSELNGFFEFCAAEFAIENPLKQTDIPSRKSQVGKSNKALTPREIVQAAREVVRELIAWSYLQADGDEGFLFGNTPKSSGEQGQGVGLFSDRREGELLPPTLLRPNGFLKYLVTVRNSDGSPERVLAPVYPTLLLLMLTVPIRMIQARLLDSGEADAEIPNVSLVPKTQALGEQSYSVEVDWWPNTSSAIAQRGRRTGVLRRFDQLNERSFVGLFINTNKTQAADEELGGDRGYEIPWEHPELMYQICRLRNWQARFNPADRLLSRADLGKRESSLTPSGSLKGSLPTYVHLFRVLDDIDVLHRQYPPTHEDCRHFFMSVMDEVEARLARAVEIANAAEPNPDRHRQPPKLITKREGRFPRVCIYTPHSLRLSGITAFAEAGVPAPIIAEFLSGHLTVLMTIYYSKFGPAVMTKVLSAVEESIDRGELEAATVEASTMSSSQLPQLFAVESESAFEAAKDQMPGFWKWSVDGICPNGMTKCAEGGPMIEGASQRKYGPVEGGARNCPLCRFWLTGPKFIAGQIIMANAALHRARTLATGLPALWEQQRDPANSSRRASIEDRIDKISAEIDLVLRTLNARARLLEKSIALSRDGESNVEGSVAPTDNLTLITRMSGEEISVHARATSELGYLEFMTRSVRLLPELEAHDAEIALGVALDRLLDENGYRACLYRLPTDLRTNASIAFLDCLRSQAPDGVQGDDFVDQVAEGKHPLFQFDLRKIEAEMSRASGRLISLEPLMISPPEKAGIGAIPAPAAAKSDELNDAA